MPNVRCCPAAPERIRTNLRDVRSHPFELKRCPSDQAELARMSGDFFSSENDIRALNEGTFLLVPLGLDESSGRTGENHQASFADDMLFQHMALMILEEFVVHTKVYDH